jgi:hypothetical protein
MPIEQIETEITVGDILDRIAQGRLSRDTKVKLVMNHVHEEPPLDFKLFNVASVTSDGDEHGLYVVVESRRQPVE